MSYFSATSATLVYIYIYIFKGYVNNYYTYCIVFLLCVAIHHHHLSFCCAAIRSSFIRFQVVVGRGTQGVGAYNLALVQCVYKCI